MINLKKILTGMIKKLLSHPCLPLILAAFSIVLAIPSLWTGLILDDYFHKAMIQGGTLFGEVYKPSIDIFKFLDGNPLRTLTLMDKGIIPWWTLEKIKINFWRPVTALTHWLDYRLWPNSSLMMHVQSLIWLGAVVIIVTLLYRRFMIGAPWVAGLGALLFAIDDAHAMPISWLANRNGLIALFFGVAAILFHDQWRRNEDYFAAISAFLCFGIALLAKESSIAVCAYLFAYAVFIEQTSRRTRALSLAPYAFITVVWRIFYNLAGYGAWGAKFYIDPLKSPVYFLKKLFVRAPILLHGQWSFPPSDLFMLFSSKGKTFIWLWSVVFIIVLFTMLMRFLRHDPVARFWFAGMMLSLVPCCAIWPFDRLLLFVGLGAMGLLAQLFYMMNNFFISAASSFKRITVGIMCLLLIFVHLILAPILLPFRIYTFNAWGKKVNHLIESTPLEATIIDKTFIIINASGSYTTYLPIIRSLKGQPNPSSILSLSHMGNFNQHCVVPMHISRPDTHTLVVQPEGGFPWLLFRDDPHPLALGTRIALSDMTVEVTKLAEGGWPLEVTYRFNLPLEDPLFVWAKIQDNECVPFILPEVGESIFLDKSINQYKLNFK